MCGGDLVGGLLDVLVIELEAVVEVVQSRAADQYRWGWRCRPWIAPVNRGTTGSYRERWLADIERN